MRTTAIRMAGAIVAATAFLGCASGGAPEPPPLAVSGELAYVRDNNKIVVMDAATGTEQELGIGKFHRVYWPSWSIDGSRLAFIGLEKSEIMDGMMRMYVFNPADSKRTDLGRVPEVGLKRRPVWSATGAVVYTRGDSLPVRYEVPPDGRPDHRAEQERITRAPITDGFNLYVYDVPTRERWKVTDLPVAETESIRATAMDPEWKRLAFNVGSYLLTVDSTRNAETRHQAESDIYWIDWHPAGDRLFFLVGPPYKHRGTGQTGGTAYGVSTLYMYSFATGEVTALLKQIRGDVDNIHPSVSSDGAFVLLEHEVRTFRRAFAVSTGGLGSRQLNDAGAASFPAWRPRAAP